MFDVYDKLPVCHDIKGSRIRTKDVIMNDEISFSSLLLEEEIHRGLEKCEYKYLSPIQKNALPLVLTGKSIIAHAKSGTGKTLIYLLTALNTYLKSKPNGLFTLILAPTREIAKQIYDVCKSISCYIKDLKIEYFIGGVPLDIDVIKCKTCHIAVGAPGRIKHLIGLGELEVQKLQLLVLDEVDVLVNNKEFGIGEVVAYLPTSRQTIVCTATYSDAIGSLLNPLSADLKYVNTNEEETQENVSSTSNMLIGIKQYVLPIFSDSSAMDSVRIRNKLVEVLKNFEYDQCFVFVNYISLVKSIYNFLASNNLSAMCLSSEQDQSTRIATLNKLKLNECKILVTTDLAARGIDVHNANLVVNLGIPMPPDVYVHRMGRAGRYGSEGSVITIVHEGEELQKFTEVVSYIVTEPVDLYLMPREINDETLRCPLSVVRCNPQPNSAVVREFIAKHAAKLENQPTENKSKKKKHRKRKAKEKSRVRRSLSHAEDGSVLSVNEVPVQKPIIPDLKELQERLSAYAVSRQHELNRYTRTEIELDSLMRLIMPAKPSRQKLFFTDYYSEPTAEKQCDLVDDDAPVDESWLSLADFTRKRNSCLDSQRIPLSVSELFALVDEKKRKNSDSANQLEIEVLEKLRVMVEPSASLKEPISDGTDSSILRATSNWQYECGRTVSTSTNDSQEPPNKFKRPVQRAADGKVLCDPTGRTNMPKIGSEDLPHYIFPTERSTSSMRRARIAKRLKGTGNEASQHEQSVLVRTVGNVQCPQCYHEFSLPSCEGSDQQTNRLPSLGLYVNSDVEQKIYQSHFNYITNCLQKVRPANLNYS